MKDKIAGIQTIDNKTMIRIKISISSQRNYTRFRKALLDKFNLKIRGDGGFTYLMGKGIDMNIFKGDKYFHIVLYATPKKRKEILPILFNYFEFMASS
mgnify:CR=1 FL=1|jgi:hypothetical protein|tara:strand:+ start:22340 stop:22633 length:294 start_codon:yes stop_codon:yes gene_type:complete